MVEFTLWQILSHLLLAARWTVALSLIAFAGGAIGSVALLLWRYGTRRVGRIATTGFIELIQGIPLLLLLFLVFFGLPLLGIDVSPWLAAGVALTLYASAYLAEIWRGSVDAIPLGQWDAAASLGLHFVQRMRLVILPQAARVAVAPTVGFLVQLLKATALASIVGFSELTRAGQNIANATFEPFLVYGLVALIYFALCFPLTLGARHLERRMAAADRA